jgi:hypothetical protein
MRISAELKVELNKVPENLREYVRLSGKTGDQVIAKKSSDLSFQIYRGLKAVAPKKGAVMAERLAALKSGGGVKVRQSVLEKTAQKYGLLSQVATQSTWMEVRKRGRVTAMSREIGGLNFRALAVQAELKLRESARGFSAYASPRPKDESKDFGEADEFAKVGDKTTRSRYGFSLSTYTARLGDTVEEKYAELRWLGAFGGYNTAADALATRKQQQVATTAVVNVNNDIRIYVERKLAQERARLGL